MKRYRLIYLYIILLSLCSSKATAQPQTELLNAPDSIRISLLTCAAGNEIYSLFGHTAIRYENYTQGIDAVFNYGIFDFNSPNFAFRFALGETDYLLGVTNYERFTSEYERHGRNVWQQTLNLNQTEQERLVKLLEENYRSENRMYRYNYFFDNCATRPRDQIEKAIIGTLQYADNMTDNDTGTTIRDLLHKYGEKHPWARFGIDLCIGSEADKPINRRVQMFVPFYVQDFFNRASIVNSQKQIRPLVTAEEKVVVASATDVHRQIGVITPMQAALLLLLLVTAATIYGVRKNRTWWGIDLVLLLTAGLVGCVIAFLVLFSQHPAVRPNYLLFVFQPLHLLCLPCVLNKVRKRKISWYMVVNGSVLTLFIGLWALIPQRIDLAIVPLALCLLVRSVGNIIMCKSNS